MKSVRLWNMAWVTSIVNGTQGFLNKEGRQGNLCLYTWKQVLHEILLEATTAAFEGPLWRNTNASTDQTMSLNT